MSTLNDLINDVKDDMDINEGTSNVLTSISDADIARWIAKGVRSAERVIHGLYEDYFLSKTTIAITANTTEYSYPSDVYANKIRKIVFDNGSEAHEVKRTKDILSSQVNDILVNSWSNPILTWTPINTSVSLVGVQKTTGRKIKLFPKEGRTGTLHVWYIRNANKLYDPATDDLDGDVSPTALLNECDIDEFEDYIVQYAKVAALLRDKDPTAADEKMILDELEEAMRSTLSDMAPDQNNELLADTSLYCDHT